MWTISDTFCSKSEISSKFYFEELMLIETTLFSNIKGSGTVLYTYGLFDAGFTLIITGENFYFF